MICCGEKMDILNANTFDASQEKHLPVIKINGDKVTVCVGATGHPMTSEHQIKWVYLQTENGGMRHVFHPEEQPTWEFCIKGDKPVAAYSYCNLHGLWKTDVK